MKLMYLPSGDQAGDVSPRSPNVICLAASVPFVDTSQRCERTSGGFAPLSGSTLLPGHSHARTVNTTRDPSGETCAPLTERRLSVSSMETGRLAPA